MLASNRARVAFSRSFVLPLLSGAVCVWDIWCVCVVMALQKPYNPYYFPWDTHFMKTEEGNAQCRAQKQSFCVQICIYICETHMAIHMGQTQRTF